MVHEIHILGSIHSYSNFSSCYARGGLQCSYSIQTAPQPKTKHASPKRPTSFSNLNDALQLSEPPQLYCAAWTQVEGENGGCTQWHSSPTGISFSRQSEGIWNHPINLVYATTGIVGWPRIRLRVNGMDRFGRRYLVGYGNCFCPGPSGSSNCKSEHKSENNEQINNKSTTMRQNSDAFSPRCSSQKLVKVVIFKPRRQGILDRLRHRLLDYDGEECDLDLNAEEREEDLFFDSIGLVHLRLDVLWKQL